MFGALAIAGTSAGIELTSSNSVSIRQGIDGTSVSQLIMDIESLDTDNVILFIDSPGGSVFAGNTLISYMEGSGKTFTCIAGFAASMAFAIFQACDERLVMSNSVLMQHQASFGLFSGPVKNQVRFVQLIVAVTTDLSAFQAERIGMTLGEFDALINDDFWVNGQRAVAANIADKVTNLSCSSSLIQSTTEVVLNTLFGKVELEFSDCPLISAPIEVDGTYVPHTALTSEMIKEINTVR